MHTVPGSTPPSSLGGIHPTPAACPHVLGDVDRREPLQGDRGFVVYGTCDECEEPVVGHELPGGEVVDLEVHR